MLQGAGTKYRLYLAEAILDETRRVLLTYQRIRKTYHYSDEEVEQFIQQLRNISEAVLMDLTEISVIKRDPKDNFILACATQAQADYIVTKDLDLLNLKKYQAIQILSTEEFLKLLRKGDHAQ